MIQPNYPAITPPCDLPPEALEDCFQPPPAPCMVRCLHCGQEYSSKLIYWDDEGKEGQGFWRCPVEDCGGAGFQFDIFPIDSSMWCDDDEEEQEYSEEEFADDEEEDQW